jgi:hypothetical protein
MGVATPAWVRVAAVGAVAAVFLSTATGTAGAAGTRPVVAAHLSVAAVAGALKAGSGISVIQVCPRGTRLARAATRTVGEFHAGPVRVASRELWPRGMVVRYRVTRTGRDGALLLTGAVCRSRVGADQTRLRGRAKVDLRVWGPTPRRVELLDAAIVAVADNLRASQVYRTSMRAAGVDESHASVRGTVRAVQQEIRDRDGDIILAAGRTHRSVARGSFVSMQNHYRYTAFLDQRVAFTR